MHYIRLLRPPAVSIRDRGKTYLHLCFTVATDLGDSYLIPPTGVALTLTYWVNGVVQRPTIPLCKWAPGSRVIKLDVPLKVLPRGSFVDRIYISPAEPELGLLKMAQLFAGSPVIVPVVAKVGVSRAEDDVHYTSRQLLLGDVQGKRLFLALEEEVRDSIAKRVWDGGLMTAGLLWELGAQETAGLGQGLGLVKEVMERDNLRILELGSGVGTLGIAFASAVAKKYQGEPGATSPHKIIMTDLPDASEVANRNIALYETGTATLIAPKISYENLDWFDCQNGVMGPLVAAEPRWDLVIISDCTYNTDVIPALVGSLDKLHERGVEMDGKGPIVMLSTKPRHDSESVFWEQMESAGWAVVEKGEYPILNLGAAEETCEVYLFRKGSA